MHESDRHRAFADRRGDPLDRLRAYVSGDEHAGHGRLQVERIAVQSPSRRTASFRQQIRSRTDEAVLVADDRVAEPVGAGGGADEDEQVPARHRLGLAVLLVAERDVFEVVVAVRLDDARAHTYADVLDLPELLVL